MSRKFWLVLVFASGFIGGCASLTEVRDRFTRTENPPIVEEIAAAPSLSPSGTTLSAPPERSSVYQSQSIQRKEGNGSRADGWSVPEAPIRVEESPAVPAPEFRTNASPDIGLVRSVPSAPITAPEFQPVAPTPAPSILIPIESTPSIASSGYQSRTIGSSTLPEIITEPSTPLPLTSTIDSPPLAQVDSPWVTDSPTYPRVDSYASSSISTSPSTVYPPAASTAPQQMASTYPPAAPIQTQQTGIVRGGQPAPTLALTTLDGQAFNLEAHRGRVVVLDFWYSTCGPCLRSMGTLAQIRGQYREDQVVILGMNADRNQRDALAAIRRGKHPWPQVFTPGQKPDPRKIFSVSLYPTFIVIDQAGNIQYRGTSVQLVASKVGELITTPSIPAGGQIGAGYLAGLN